MDTLEYTPLHDIASIIDNTRRFYKTGTTQDLSFRKHQLKQILRFVEENNKELEHVLWCDLKKNRHEVLAETGPLINECKYLINNLDILAKPVSPKKWYCLNALNSTAIHKEPKGVVLVIGTWNYPIHLSLMPVVGAIAAGNCVVLKLSEIAPHSAAYLTKTIPRYLDQRFFKIINGAVPETTMVLDQPFDHIFYTGGAKVGKLILEKAAQFLTPVTLELGGKSPTLVAPDAVNQTTANRIMFGKLLNAGQTCVAPDYILVERDHAEALVQALHQSIQDFYGGTSEKSDSYGRIISKSHFDRLTGLLDSVDPKTVIVGGQSNRDDLFIAPTIIYPASANGTALMENEIFGPILSVVPIDSMDDGIDIINAKPHPLVIYIFSSQRDLVNKVIKKTTSGAVLVNDTMMHILEASLPFGGVGASGMGNYHGEHSFNTFSHARSVMINNPGFESVMTARYPPYTQEKYYLANALIHGLPSNVIAKIQAIKRFIESSIPVLFGPSSSNTKYID